MKIFSLCVIKFYTLTMILCKQARKILIEIMLRFRVKARKGSTVLSPADVSWRSCKVKNDKVLIITKLNRLELFSVPLYYPDES